MKEYQTLKQVVFYSKQEIQQLPAGTRIHAYGDGTTYEVVADGIRIWQPGSYTQKYIILFDKGFGWYNYSSFYLIKTSNGKYV